MTKTKKCSTCGEIKSLDDFTKCKTIKSGYKYSCKVCIKEYYKNYRESNRERIKINQDKHKTKNYQKILNRSRDWQNNHKERVYLKNKNWTKNNPEKVYLSKKKYSENNKTKRNEESKLRRLNDPVFNFKIQIRNAIKESIKRKNFTKKSRTHEILGCSFKFLYGYLMITFYNNYKRLPTKNDCLHVDHLIPLATATTEKEVIKLNHYTNLQWLLAKDNLEKSDKVNYNVQKG